MRLNEGYSLFKYNNRPYCAIHIRFVSEAFDRFPKTTLKRAIIRILTFIKSYTDRILNKLEAPNELPIFENFTVQDLQASLLTLNDDGIVPILIIWSRDPHRQRAYIWAWTLSQQEFVFIKCGGHNRDKELMKNEHEASHLFQEYLKTSSIHPISSHFFLRITGGYISLQMY